MKRIPFLLITLLALLSGTPATLAQGLKLTVDVPDLPTQDIILSHRFGMKFYTDDTARTDAAGRASFTKTQLLPRGMYQLVFPNKKFVEFFLDVNQAFTINTRASAPGDSVRYSGSPENSRFTDWQHGYARNRERSAVIQARLKKGSLTPDSTRILNQELQTIQQTVNKMWDTYGSALNGTLPGKFINGLRPVKIPEALGKPDAADKQKIQYEYVRAHFFDGVDLKDEGLLRTPLIETKIDQYFNQVMPQIADSLITEAVKIIERVRPSKEMYQFVVQYLFNLYTDPKIMGTDAVYVYLADSYYLNGQTPWIDSANLRGIRVRADELRPLLLGKVAPDLQGLVSDKEQVIDFKSIKSKYLILYFWSPECGFCKEATPKLASVYPDLKNLGAEILAVNTRLDKPEWLKFIEDHQLGWINVFCPVNTREMIDKYQAFTTPCIYILDSSKKIIAKSISWDQVKPFLKQYQEMSLGR